MGYIDCDSHVIETRRRPGRGRLLVSAPEIKFAEEHGAVGVHVTGVEHGLFLSDPYFYPLYECVQDLDLAIAVHLGEFVQRVEQQEIARLIWAPPAIMGHFDKVMTGFHAVHFSENMFDSHY